MNLDDLATKARVASAGWVPGDSDTRMVAVPVHTVLGLVAVARAATANQSPVPDGTMQEMGTVINERFRALDAALAALEAL